MARLTEAASRDSNRRTQLPRPTPSHVKLPLDIRSLTLPQGCVLETPKTGYSSPAAIINPSIFTSPAKSLGMTDGARYSCTHGSYGGRFIRLQELLGHEYTAIHADNTPSVERVLFQESKNEIESVETEGNDIRYNSVLSSWAGSYTTDEVRFALDSLAEDGPDHLSITNMAEDLWKDDLPVMDPFAVPFVNLPDSYKEKGIHSGLESGHGVFAACVDSMTLMDSHCMHPSSAFTASSAEFPH